MGLLKKLAILYDCFLIDSLQRKYAGEVGMYQVERDCRFFLNKPFLFSNHIRDGKIMLNYGVNIVNAFMENPLGRFRES